MPVLQRLLCLLERATHIFLTKRYFAVSLLRARRDSCGRQQDRWHTPGRAARPLEVSTILTCVHMTNDNARTDRNTRSNLHNDNTCDSTNAVGPQCTWAWGSQ